MRDEVGCLDALIRRIRNDGMLVAYQQGALGDARGKTEYAVVHLKKGRIKLTETSIDFERA